MRFDKNFNHRSDAWRFMALCDELGIKAGFPELLWPWTVWYLIP